LTEDFFTYLDEMTDMIDRHISWEKFEKQFYQRALNSDAALAKHIKQIDLTDYQISLKTSFKQAIKQAKQKWMVAIYFEYNCDNGWESDFLLCKYYLPKHMLANDQYTDDWACEFDDEVIEGPAIEEFSDIFTEESSDSDEVQAYLIARTLAIFGDTYDQIKVNDLAICIAFHDQDPIVRIQEFFPPSDRLFDSSKLTPLTGKSFTELEHYMISHYSQLITKFENDNDIKLQIKKTLFFYKDDILINYCPFCGKLRRTPRAKQCPSCFKREW